MCLTFEKASKRLIFKLKKEQHKTPKLSCYVIGLPKLACLRFQNSREYSKLKSFLENLKIHFGVFITSFMKEVIKSSDEDLEKREFLHKFDLTRCEVGILMY